MDEGRNMILLFPTLIKFNGDKEVIAKFAPRWVPSYHICISIRISLFGSSSEVLEW